MTRDLVERARNGDHDACTVLAGAAISRLDATAFLMLRDTDRATDAVRNALIRAWRDLSTLRDPDRLDAWLHRLLVNACIDEIRRLRRRPFEIDVDVTDLNLPFSADAVSAVADRDQLERGFRRLDPEERAVIVLHHYWSADGTRLVFERTDSSRMYRLAVGSVTGGHVVEIGPARPDSSGGAQARFASDGTKVLAFYNSDRSAWILDPADGSAFQLAEEIASPLSGPIAP